MDLEVKRSLIKVWLRVTKEIDRSNREMLLERIDDLPAEELNALYEFYEEGRNAERERPLNKEKNEVADEDDDNSSEPEEYPASVSGVELEEEPHTLAPGLKLVFNLLALFAVFGLIFGGFPYMSKRKETQFKETMVAVICDSSFMEFYNEALNDPYSRNTQVKAYESAIEMEKIIKNHGYDSVTDFEKTGDEYASDHDMQLEILRMAKDQCGYDISSMPSYTVY